MANNSDNGMLWALGTVGAVALAGMVIKRGTMSGSRSVTHRCSTCGVPSHLRGSRAVDEQVDEDPTRRGTFLLRNRFDAKNGFTLSMKDCRALRASWPSLKAQYELKAKQSTPSQLDAMLKHQGEVLFSNGIGKLTDPVDAKGKPVEGEPVLIEPISAHAYAEAKAKARMQRVKKKIREGTSFQEGTLGLATILKMGGLTRADKAAGVTKQKMPIEPKKGVTLSATEQSRLAAFKSLEAMLFDEFRRYYLMSVYVEREWTIHVLTKYKKLDRDARSTVYGTVGSRLFDGIDFRLALSSPVTDANGRPMFGSSAFVMEQSASDTLAEDEQDAETAEEADDDEVIVGGDGIPELYLFKGKERQGIFFVSEVGTQYFRYGKARVTLLTKTSKMSSPSFGLPAGMPTEGGTCPARMVAQRLSRMREMKIGKKRKPIMAQQTMGIICDRCYAMGANYGYANNMIDQEGRARWVKNLVDKQGTDAAAQQIALMIAGYAQNGAHGGRDTQEIGVWSTSDNAITYRSGRKRMPCADTQLRLKLKGADGRDVPTTRAWFKSRGVSNGDITGFFRIHDSGDFGIGKKYMEAWEQVFEMLPFVQFWAPTRMWAKMEKVIKASAKQKAFNAEMMAHIPPEDYVSNIAYRQVAGQKGSSNLKPEQPSPTPSKDSPGEAGAKVNDLASDEKCGDIVVPDEYRLASIIALASHDNAAIRPSTLYVTKPDGWGANIPYIEGMSRGSGVAEATDKESSTYPPVCDMEANRAYKCPVYTRDANGKEAKSCHAANCRACWLAKDIPVFYGAH